MHKIKGIFVSTLLLLSLLAIIAPVSAGTIHVYPGDDLEAIVEAAPAGSTIYVHAGTYILVDDIRIGQDNITLIGDGATTTIIERDLDAVPGPSMLIGIDGVKNVTITGFTFKNSNDSAIYLETSTANATISNNIIVDGSYRGILGWNNVTGTIKNNLILRCAYHGISVRSNVTIINNSVISCKGGGIYIDNGADATIKNNIIVSNETFGIGADLGGGNPIINIEYNNVWNNGINYQNSVKPGPGNISADPRFVDGVDTFYLNQSSPCVNSGSDQSSTLGLYNGYTTRADGKWDTGTVDMGYHYKSTRGPPGSSPIAKILEIIKGNKNK